MAAGKQSRHRRTTHEGSNAVLALVRVVGGGAVLGQDEVGVVNTGDGADASCALDDGVQGYDASLPVVVGAQHEQHILEQDCRSAWEATAHDKIEPGAKTQMPESRAPVDAHQLW